MEELDLIDLFYMVKRRLWLIILLVAIAGGAAYGVTEFMMVPEYSTHAQLWLGQATGGESDTITSSEISLNRNLITTYAAMAKTKIILNEVKAELEAGWNEGIEDESKHRTISTSYLKSVINIQLRNSTEIIQVSAYGTSPEFITEVINVFVDVFAKEIPEIMKIDNVKILEYAEVPKYPYAPSLKKNLMLACGAGGALALFIIFLLEMFDRTIKVPEDVTRHLGLPVLGMIPEHD
jgi:capsular polysaccharide biosynthesis protein